MTCTTEEEIILKTDVLGRVHMPKGKRELILDRFEEGGMSGKAFASQIGIKYPTFASWIQKRRRERGDYANKESVAPIALFEAVMDSPEPGSSFDGIEVETNRGVRIRLSSQNEIPLAIALLNGLKDAQL